MIELIKEWADLEPARCKWTENEYYKCYEVQVQNDWDNASAYSVQPHQEVTVEPYNHPWIEFAVREAILARGWGFKLTNMFEPNSGDAPAVDNFTAEVFVCADGNYADVIYYENDDDPTKALLSAYLTAVKGPQPEVPEALESASEGVIVMEW